MSGESGWRFSWTVGSESGRELGTHWVGMMYLREITAFGLSWIDACIKEHVVYIFIFCTYTQERPYHNDSTASRLLSEVKHCRARLVLRWGTTLESLVLFFCTFDLACHAASDTWPCLCSNVAS